MTIRRFRRWILIQREQLRFTMPAQISLQLDRPTYRPGETVHGTVHLTARSDLRPRGVIVHAFGEEVTTLGPNALMTQRSNPFDLSFNLWSPTAGGSPTAHDDKLPKGEYDFPFEFTLPATLPPTFNGEFTRILYVIAAKVDLPLHSDIHHEHQFTVLSAPLTEADKAVRTATQSPQGVRVELALTASGFYPGDHIQGTLQVTGTESTGLTAATVEIVSREKAEAREFADHFDKVRVRAEIDPARISGGQPFDRSADPRGRRSLFRRAAFGQVAFGARPDRLRHCAVGHRRGSDPRRGEVDRQGECHHELQVDQRGTAVLDFARGVWWRACHSHRSADRSADRDAGQCSATTSGNCSATRTTQAVIITHTSAANQRPSPSATLHHHYPAPNHSCSIRPIVVSG
jgi:hypothetical protein